MKKRKQMALSELNPQNIHAIALVGDNWVQTSIIDADPLGRVYFIAHQSQSLTTRKGCTPSLSKITRALVECWQGMSASPCLDYQQFFLCLPAWATSCTSRTTSISIAHDERIPCFRTPKVSGRDIRRAVESASVLGLSRQEVTLEILPRHFGLEGGRRVYNPIGELTRDMTMTSDMVVSEQGVLETMLSVLGEQDVKVDIVTSAAAAAAGCLNDQERSVGTAVIHVGRSQVSLSCFSAGTLLHATSWGGGADAVLATAADNLDTDVRRVSELAVDRELWLFSCHANQKVSSLPLFKWSTTHPILQHLEYAAREAVLRLADEAMRNLCAAMTDKSLAIERVVLLGDEPLTTRSLKEFLEQSMGIRCRIDIPGNVHLSQGAPRIFDHALTVGFIRRCVSPGQRHYCYLDRYNETPVDAVTRIVTDRTRDLSLRMARRVADVVENRARNKQIGEMFSRTQQCMKARISAVPMPGTPRLRGRMKIPRKKKLSSRLPIKML